MDTDRIDHFDSDQMFDRTGRRSAATLQRHPLISEAVQRLEDQYALSGAFFRRLLIVDGVWRMEVFNEWDGTGPKPQSWTRWVDLEDPS